MNQSTKSLARQLLAREAASGSDATVQVCSKLRTHLTSLVGTAGFRALLHRALALCKLDVSKFESTSVREDGTLAGYEVFVTQCTPRQVEDGGVELIGQLLALLEIFLGEALTRQILKDVWPA
jgi:hypothetical protein